MRQVSFWAVLLGAVGLSGCGSPGPTPVSGLVTLDGKPLAGAAVTFLPKGKGAEDFGASFGKTGPDGRYTLVTIRGERPGAVPGEHAVTISIAKPSAAKGNDGDEETLPSRYNTKSELTFPVPAGGTDQANFELTSKQSK